MKTTLTSKILRKALVLAFLIVGLVFVASSGKTSQTVLAAPCCSECQPRYEDCVAGCPEGGAGSSCRNICNNSRNSCNSNCDMSCGGGSTGSACNTDFDCPEGCTCQMSQQHSMEYMLLEQQKNMYCSACLATGHSDDCANCSYYSYLYENYPESHPNICSCP